MARVIIFDPAIDDGLIKLSEIISSGVKSADDEISWNVVPSLRNAVRDTPECGARCGEREKREIDVITLPLPLSDAPKITPAT